MKNSDLRRVVDLAAHDLPKSSEKCAQVLVMAESLLIARNLLGLTLAIVVSFIGASSGCAMGDSLIQVYRHP